MTPLQIQEIELLIKHIQEAITEVFDNPINELEKYLKIAKGVILWDVLKILLWIPKSVPYNSLRKSYKWLSKKSNPTGNKRNGFTTSHGKI
jgi:hypothetical protein